MAKSKTAKKPSKVKPTGPDKTIMTMDLPLEEIRIDGETQPRCEIDQQAVEDYAADMKGGDTFPPGKCVYDGVSYWLYGGFHRRFAHEKAGKKKMKVEVVQGTLDDARRLCLKENVGQGKRRTNEDKQRAIALGIQWWPKLSNRKIADLCGVSHVSVNRFRGKESGTLFHSDSPDAQTESDANGQPADPTLPAFEETKVEQCSTPDSDFDDDEESASDTEPTQKTDDADEDAPTTQPVEPTQENSQEEGEEIARKMADAPVVASVTCPVDEAGIPIREDIRDAFETREIFDKLISDIRAVQKGFTLLAASPGGPLLASHLTRTERDGRVSFRCEHLTNAIGKLKWARPYASVCPYCHGTGDGKVVKTCKACYALGWVIEDTWKRAPGDYCEAAKADALEGAMP